MRETNDKKIPSPIFPKPHPRPHYNKESPLHNNTVLVLFVSHIIRKPLTQISNKIISTTKVISFIFGSQKANGTGEKKKVRSMRKEEGKVAEERREPSGVLDSSFSGFFHKPSVILFLGISYWK